LNYAVFDRANIAWKIGDLRSLLGDGGVRGASGPACGQPKSFERCFGPKVRLPEAIKGKIKFGTGSKCVCC
jgi:hypothetical protein